MIYNIGDYVVFPLHGAGIVKNLITRSTEEGEKEFYEIEFPYGSLKLCVPVDNAREAGLRPIIRENELPALLDYIQESEFTPDNQNWNKRQKSSLDMVKSGDIKKTIDVFKYLILRERTKVLSSGEKKMLVTIQKSLESEIHYATGKTFEEIDLLLFKNIG